MRAKIHVASSMQPLMLFPFVFNGWILMQCINLQFHQPTTFLIRVRARSRPLAKLSHLWRRDCRRELLVKSTGDAGELDESSRGDKTECKNAIQIASVDENSPTLRKRSRRAFIRHFSKLATTSSRLHPSRRLNLRQKERERERERERGYFSPLIECRKERVQENEEDQRSDYRSDHPAAIHRTAAPEARFVRHSKMKVNSLVLLFCRISGRNPVAAEFPSGSLSRHRTSLRNHARNRRACRYPVKFRIIHDLKGLARSTDLDTVRI